MVQGSDTYTPHSGQAEVHASDAKVKVLEVARRWGKSRFALFEGLDHYTQALDIPVSNQLVPPFHMWVVVPSYPQGRQTWHEMVSLMPTEFASSRGIRQDEWIIYLKGAAGREWGLIELKSAHDPSSLQTVGLDYLWVNEAQDIPNEAFEKLLPTLRSPERMGYAVFEGIPPTYADHWFHMAFLAGERGRADYLSYKATAFDNPFLTHAQKEEIRKDRELITDAAWRRMYLAEFSERSSYFSNVDACLIGDLLKEPVPGARYVGGLDLGRKVDATVLHIYDAVKRQLVYHRAWDNGQSWVVQREGLSFIQDLWQMDRLVVDATTLGGDIFCSELQEIGIPVDEYVISWQTRDRLLNTLAVAIERETVHFPPVPSLLRQLRAFQARRQPGGGYKIEAPPGEHDDEVFAAALALTACDAEQRVGVMPRGGRMRYMPTQAEANGGISNVRQMLDQRDRERTIQRWEEAGIRL